MKLNNLAIKMRLGTEASNSEVGLNLLGTEQEKYKNEHV